MVLMKLLTQIVVCLIIPFMFFIPRVEVDWFVFGPFTVYTDWILVILMSAVFWMVCQIETGE